MNQPIRTAALVALILTGLTLTGCGADSPEQALDRYAETYVWLAMSLDAQHAGGQQFNRKRLQEVDAWFGPERFDTRTQSGAPSLEELRSQARALRAQLAADASATESALTGSRAARLLQRVDELLAVLAFTTAETPITFAEETAMLYGIGWREAEPEAFVALRAALDAALPGRGSLRARLGGLRQRLIIPSDRRLAVFERALAECRRRTLKHWAMPPQEQLEIVTTQDVDSAWHVYHGTGRSTLLLNELALGTVDQAIDVACHEGYPGHHAQFVLFEAAAGAAGLALEDQLVLLRSPAAALREGAAMHGVDLVFPAAERLAFERDVLFPMAGIDPQLAELLAAVRPLLDRLEAVVPLVIRDHEDNGLGDSQAILRLQTEALVSSPRQLFAFAHEVGAYLAGYTLVRQALQERLPVTEADSWVHLRQWLERPERWADSGSDAD